ncbi:hypothetical protein OOJ91_17950 [Micromonospora lupini]|uniref:hypothetical protein n=1 Tax=Micromonospora lupini TaxID=285679 RepID=UPI00225B932F|nr:hypothetical protein [Micromonospora lupini]MCX5067726.1 hypothetical protein [Micromonospora lupini]
MSDLEPRLRERFTAYRADVTTRAVGPGPDQARRTLRRRRQTRAVAVAAAAVVLVLAPVVANAARRGDHTPPVPAVSVEPTAPATPDPTPTPPPTPSGSASPTGSASEAPDGQISRAQVLAARVDLPTWPQTVPSTCTTSNVRLATSSTKSFVPLLTDLTVDHADLDGDGAQETVAVVACRYGEALAKQVVAFDRDDDGRIVTLGRVVRTTDGVEDILGVTVTEDGSIDVRVADLQPCCDTPRYWPQEQTRTYRFKGGRFVQTDGPTKFGKDPRLTDLRLSMTHTLVDVTGGRELTTVFTVTNAGPVDAPQVQFRGLEVGAPTTGDWSRCDPAAAAADNDLTCLVPGVPAGESRRYTFVQMVPSRSGPDATTRSIFVTHYDAQDRQWRDRNEKDNKVQLPGVF